MCHCSSPALSQDKCKGFWVPKTHVFRQPLLRRKYFGSVNGSSILTHMPVIRGSMLGGGRSAALVQRRCLEYRAIFYSVFSRSRLVSNSACSVGQRCLESGKWELFSPLCIRWAGPTERWEDHHPMTASIAAVVHLSRGFVIFAL